MQAEAQLEIDLSQGTCALLAETVVKVLTLNQVEENAKAGKNSTVVSEAMANLVPSYAGGEWSLFFANCQKPSVVSFDVRLEMYNLHNGQKDYLSIGEDMIPAVYLVGLSPWCIAYIHACVAIEAPIYKHEPSKTDVLFLVIRCSFCNLLPFTWSIPHLQSIYLIFVTNWPARGLSSTSDVSHTLVLHPCTSLHSHTSFLHPFTNIQPQHALCAL